MNSRRVTREPWSSSMRRQQRQGCGSNFSVLRCLVMEVLGSPVVTVRILRQSLDRCSIPAPWPADPHLHSRCQAALRCFRLTVVALLVQVQVEHLACARTHAHTHAQRLTDLYLHYRSQPAPACLRSLTAAAAEAAAVAEALLVQVAQFACLPTYLLAACLLKHAPKHSRTHTRTYKQRP